MVDCWTFWWIMLGYTWYLAFGSFMTMMFFTPLSLAVWPHNEVGADGIVLTLLLVSLIWWRE